MQDKFGRVISRSSDLEVITDLARRIAVAGAWCAVATDDDVQLAHKPRPIGQSAAWHLENPDGVHVDPEDLERVVGGG